MVVLSQEGVLGLLGTRPQVGFRSEAHHNLFGPKNLGRVRHTDPQVEGCVGNQAGIDVGLYLAVLAASLQFPFTSSYQASKCRTAAWARRSPSAIAIALTDSPISLALS